MSIFTDTAKSYINFFKRPSLLSYLQKVAKHVYIPILELKAEYFPSKEPIDIKNIKGCNFKPIKRGEQWSKEQFDCAWFHFTGKLNEVSDDLVGIINLDGEGCVYKDNVPVQGLTGILGIGDIFQPKIAKQVVEFENLTIDKNGNVSFYVEAGKNGAIILGTTKGKAILKQAIIAKRRTDVLAFYYDMLYLHQYRNVITDSDKTQISKDLYIAKNLAGKFSHDEIQTAREFLSKYFTGENNNPFEITAVGHAHLDLAWLWPIRETKRKAERTYTNALTNIKRYDNFVFGSSQPQQFEWIKENRPELYKKIKEAVKKGQIEAQGIMWCEPDTNIPSGESLIRQCYYGKKFFCDEFDKNLDYLWVPDVFGYTASLPRILNGCGADKLMTIKLSWNNINKFPYHSFKWEGIGDSEVLVHMPPEGDYNSCGSPYVVKKVQKNYRENKVSNYALMPFGCGDGGGGPSEYNINIIDRQSKMALDNLPRIKFGTASEFFKKLETEKENLPSYKGELYLEKHQGTYTTQSRMKRDMRKAEVMLHNVEFLATVASINGGNYPKNDLDKIWKSVLLHQFHDILPGSSIKRVYDEAKITFANHRKSLKNLAENAMKTLPEYKKPCVLNTTSFTRTGDIKYKNKWYSYKVLPYSSAELLPFKKCNFNFDNETIENEKLRVKFNDKGEIIEVFDKVNKINSVAKTFNSMRVYRDRNEIPYGAWDIDINYMKKPSLLMRQVDARTYIEGGEVIRVQTLKYNKSTLYQKIYLKRNKPVVIVENEIDWHERLKMLRADFYPKYFSDKVKCDIQMGYIDRSTKTDNKKDYAMFEICAHKWVDVSDDEYGFALINDCKYGHRVKDELVSLNLLRSPVHPDKMADRGKHKFTYAIYPHKGSALESDLIKYGYELNYDLTIINKKIGSLINVDNDAVVIENIMVTDNGKIALRLYESKGEKAIIKLNIKIPYKKIVQSNLLYENPIKTDINELQFSPFEIKTILISPEI